MFWLGVFTFATSFFFLKLFFFGPVFVFVFISMIIFLILSFDAALIYLGLMYLIWPVTRCLIFFFLGSFLGFFF